MKANVYVYLTNGNIVRLYVANPVVATCNKGNEVGIFDHCGFRSGIDDYEEWYEDVSVYWTTEVACIFADGKCEWYNRAYFAPSKEEQRQCGLYTKSLETNAREEFIEGMFN